MSFSRWAMSKISARCSWTCLRISWTKNQRSPCLLKSKNIQHAIVELSSWFHTLRHVFPRCWGCKTARTDGFLSPTIQPTLRKILPRITEVGHGEAEAAQQNLLVSYRQKWPEAEAMLAYQRVPETLFLSLESPATAAYVNEVAEVCNGWPARGSAAWAGAVHRVHMYTYIYNIIFHKI